MGTPRSMWKGVIGLGLLTIPIKIYKATDDRGGITLNQLHKGCGLRISMPKKCPEHGELLPSDIEKGYEYSPGQYVSLSDAEMDSVALPSLRQMTISQFVPAASFGFPKDTYFIGPDPLGAKAYNLLRDTMAESGVLGVTQVTLRQREVLATIGVLQDILVLTTMFWPDEVRDHADLVIDTPAASAPERQMASTLVSSMTGTFDPNDHQDLYRQALVSLIEDKIAGRPPVVLPEPSPTPALDLTAMLMASVEAEKSKKKPARGKAE